MPGVDLGLQVISQAEQRGVGRRENLHQGRKSAPERLGLHTSARDRLVIDKIVQDFVDLEPLYANGRSHRGIPELKMNHHAAAIAAANQWLPARVDSGGLLDTTRELSVLFSRANLILSLRALNKFS